MFDSCPVGKRTLHYKGSYSNIFSWIGRASQIIIYNQLATILNVHIFLTIRNRISVKYLKCMDKTVVDDVHTTITFIEDLVSNVLSVYNLITSAAEITERSFWDIPLTPIINIFKCSNQMRNGKSCLQEF